MKNEDIVELLRRKKQIVLQGAPGTGKTYTTAEVAVLLCDGELPDNGRTGIMQRYQQLEKEGRIGFTTFHQSMDYEQFVEGIVPVVQEGNFSMTYEVRDGIFKKMAKAASLWNLSMENTSLEDSSFSVDTIHKAYVDLVERIKVEDKVTVLSKTGKNYKLRIEKCKENTENEYEAIYFPTSDEDKYSNNPKNNDSKLMRWSKLETLLNKYHSWESYDNSNDHNGDDSKLWALLKYLYETGCKGGKHDGDKPYVLIIDEINRGNISKILGELITLLEADKRQGGENEVKATLPYSQEEFSVPQNLYIIGTMNTADRSVGYIDYAVRRRFAFYTIKADKGVIENRYKDPSLQEKATSLFDNIKKHIDEYHSSDVSADDIMVGHSYFLADDEDELKLKLDYEIKPLLKEYYSDGLITKEYEAKYDNM